MNRIVLFLILAFIAVAPSIWSGPVTACLRDTATGTTGIVSAFDIHGRRLLDMPSSGVAASFSVEGWPKGMYVVIIHTPAGNIAKRLVVK